MRTAAKVRATEREDKRTRKITRTDYGRGYGLFIYECRNVKGKTKRWGLGVGMIQGKEGKID